MIIVSPKDISKLKGKDLIKLQCECCSGHFDKNKTYVVRSLRTNNGKYCSRLCQNKNRRNKVEVNCKNCSKIFYKIPSQIYKSKNNFCNRSCAATYNNKHSVRNYGPKKVKFYYCRICSKELDRRVYCEEHRPSILLKTIAELENTNTSPSNKHCNIRSNARYIAKTSGLLDKCKVCSYSIHIVTCHIKGIASFGKNTTISVVNDISNLIGLCPNHHWEFDHNLLSDKDRAKL